MTLTVWETQTEKHHLCSVTRSERLNNEVKNSIELYELQKNISFSPVCRCEEPFSLCMFAAASPGSSSVTAVKARLRAYVCVCVCVCSVYIRLYDCLFVFLIVTNVGLTETSLSFELSVNYLCKY